VPAGGLLSEGLLATVAAATVFSVMFDLGLAMGRDDSRWVARQPVLIGKALFAVLLAVPAVAWMVVRVADLPRLVEAGILLMAIAPGAPVALRRSIDTGGHRSFAPALQILVATLAVVSMPLSLAVLDAYYGANIAVEPHALARQVLIAQLAPLAAGLLVRRIAPAWTARFEPRIHRLTGFLLSVLVILAVVDFGPAVLDAGVRVVIAIIVVTLAALAVGHALGGPDPATRTAAAITTAMRNPGLALLVATVNNAPPQVSATVVAYLVVSAVTVLAYIAWRKRTAVAQAAAASS
jgi:BASS family bile acid:Na+ symporter